MEICGFMTGVDQYGRITWMYPMTRCGKDLYGTYDKLHKFEHKGWSPLKKDGFITKIDKRALLLDEKGQTVKLEYMMQKMVKLEVECAKFDFPTKKGWFINVKSMTCLDLKN